MIMTKFIFSILLFLFPSLCFPQNAFFNLGKSYADMGNYEEAIRLTKYCLENDINKTDKFDLLIDYCTLSDYYSRNSQPDSCKSYVQKALDLYTEVKGVNYVDILSDLSISLLKAGFHQQAIDFRKEILNIIIREEGQESPLLIDQYRLLSYCYKESNNSQEVIEYAKQAEILSYLNRKNNLDNKSLYSYDDCYSNLICVLQIYEEPIPGINYMLQCLNNHRDAINRENWSATLNAIWAISKDNNFEEGCLSVYKEYALYGNYKEKLTNFINIDVEDTNIINDIHAAEYAQPLYELTLDNKLGKWYNDEEIELLLSVLPEYYGKIGLVRNSFEIAKRNYEWRKNKNKNLSLSDVYILISGSALSDEIPYAIEIGEGILESKRFENDEGVLNLIYQNLAQCYIQQGNNIKANEYLSLIKEDGTYYALRSKAAVYFDNNDYSSLLPLALKLLKYPNVLEKDREMDFWILMSSARELRNSDILKRYAPEYLSTYRINLLKNLPLLDQTEQAHYLNKSIFTNNLTSDFFIGIKGTDFEWVLPKEAYDYTLLRKGILLSTQQEYRNQIRNNLNSENRETFSWDILHNENDNYDIRNEVIKRELVNKASKLESYLKNLSYTWLDVKNALKDDEAAIEFILLYNWTDINLNDVDPKFIALIIRKDIEEPIPVILNPNIYFSNINPSDLLSQQNDLLYNLIWNPLEPYLNGVQTIFFSPDGNFHYFPIEYLSKGDHRVCDKWNLIRVSSTREVIEFKSQDSKGNIVLYGGLLYDPDIDDLIMESRKDNLPRIDATRTLVDENLRYKVNYLPSTSVEVREIAKLFNTRAIVKTGIEGTEDSFKKLSGKSIDILHIATHGFFWNEQEALTLKKVDFIKQSERLLKKEEKALMFSGLLFTGAKYGLIGESIPEDIEDGILTAKEISELDLASVDLVVISACDSGLGEFTGEGVFGLQRGFKLAGVNSLFMSLWKVDDNATRILMTEFYKNYLSGKSKRESLRLAQLLLQESEEFSDPTYWAAFVILD